MTASRLNRLALSSLLAFALTASLASALERTDVKSPSGGFGDVKGIGSSSSGAGGAGRGD